MKNIFFLSLLGIVLCAIACKPKQKVAETPPKTAEKRIAETDKPSRGKGPRYMIVQIERGNCFGKCPAYTARIWNDGVAEYEGKRHVTNIGKFTASVTAETIKNLHTVATKTAYLENVEKFAAKPKTPVPTDLPALNFYYNSGEKEGYVALKGASAPEFDEIIAATEKAVNALKWEIVK
jgi:Domain of unknown function (DUF6438)